MEKSSGKQISQLQPCLGSNKCEHVKQNNKQTNKKNITTLSKDFKEATKNISLSTCLEWKGPTVLKTGREDGKEQNRIEKNRTSLSLDIITAQCTKLQTAAVGGEEIDVKKKIKSFCLYI